MSDKPTADTRRGSGVFIPDRAAADKERADRLQRARDEARKPQPPPPPPPQQSLWPARAQPARFDFRSFAFGFAVASAIWSTARLAGWI